MLGLPLPYWLNIFFSFPLSSFYCISCLLLLLIVGIHFFFFRPFFTFAFYSSPPSHSFTAPAAKIRVSLVTCRIQRFMPRRSNPQKHSTSLPGIPILWYGTGSYCPSIRPRMDQLISGRAIGRSVAIKLCISMHLFLVVPIITAL